MGRFLNKDTWKGDENLPMSYNSWLYVYANPVNLIDPTGLNPNCVSPYAGESFCAFVRFDEILKENVSNGARALVALFTDSELQNLWGKYAGTTSAQRLEWILFLTFGSTDLNTNFGAHVLKTLANVNLQTGYMFPSTCIEDPTNPQCGCGIASELEDAQFYVEVWDRRPQVTNQINHFLSGVAEYYYGKDLRTIIAHEKSQDKRRNATPWEKLQDQWQNLNNEVTSADLYHWYRAEHYDTNGMYAERDNELWTILAFDSRIELGQVDPERQGNSLQDMRLSLRSVRFAKWVEANRNSNPGRAGEWLTINLLP
jgi:hypothetical protein